MSCNSQLSGIELDAMTIIYVSLCELYEGLLSGC